jgi:hypothetical protein
LINQQQQAMSQFDLKKMEDLVRLQDLSRRRIVSLESRRRKVIQQISRASGSRMDLKLPEIAAMFPQKGPALLKHRETLRDLIDQVGNRSRIASKLASSVVGHLNTMVRLVAGAVEKAGLYGSDGVPKMSSRVGVIEAVG